MLKRKLADDPSLQSRMRVHKTPPVALRRAVAAATIALGVLGPVTAHALGLGRLTVLSALGEPLRAEIDVPQISADEAASLKADVAAPDAFRTAGVDYNSALSGLKITLQQRADGTRYLQIRGEKTVSEPYVDLILEAHWASGRIVRDYTMLFDPPGMAPPAAAAPVAAQIPAAPPAQAPSPAPAAAPISAPVEAAPVPAAAQEPPRAASRAPATPAPVAAKASAPAVAGGGSQVKVQTGDTAGRIAAANKPANVSLDQMLVAMLRANPEAFIGGNVNRVRAGALLDLPGAEQAASVDAAEARKVVTVQSADFNAFRKRLAQSAPTTRTATTSREVSGKVQAQVQEAKPVAAAPDKLTLSKGAVKAGTREAKIAETRQKKEAADRVAELSKNLSDLTKLQGSTGPAKAASATPGPTLPVGQPATPPASAPGTVASAAQPAASAAAGAATNASAATPPSLSTASAPASGPAEAATTAASQTAAPTESPASTPVAPSQKTKPPAAKKLPPPPPEPSFIDELLDNPLLPAGAVGLVVLLAGFGFYRARQRRKSVPADSSFLESRGQPDSFFGSSGGQHVDTNDEAAPTGSSLAYSPSQLDAAGDVDPVAEADVYLAYGRDIQAEEILKEALKLKPTRVGIHVKLLEIYAKRRDARAFENLAAEAHKLTQGEGLEWEHICELGRDLDSQSPLYQPGGKPKAKSSSPTDAELVQQVFASSTLPAEPTAEFAPSAPSPDLDLDLDLDLDAPVAPAPGVGTDTATPPSKPVAADMEWSAPAAAHPEPATAQNATGPRDAPAVEIPPAQAPAADDAGMIEFDLGSLSLDLDHSLPKAEPSSEAPASAFAAMVPGEVDAMETKLSLAQEFHTIGDTEGARVLVEEVVASATGPLKAKAQRFLAELS